MNASDLRQSSNRWATWFAMLLVSLAVLGGFASTDAVWPKEQTVQVHVFSEPGCPYCQSAKAFLRDEMAAAPWLEMIDHDVESDARALELFEVLNRRLGVDTPGVPLIVVGAKAFIGFDTPETTGAEIMDAATQCRRAPCRNLYAELSALENAGAGTGEPDAEAQPTVTRPGLREKIDLPFVGAIDTSALSLPVLTILLAAVDGFNPCAMWVLVFLIGLLLGLEDRTRMWLLGGAFLITSAGVYFLFLAAWLNVFLFLGALLWIRLLVGGFAVAGGVYYLREFATNPEGACKVTEPGQRRTIMDSLKGAVGEKNFWPALGGIVVLAAAVNLIELLCSAGLPAVFTNVLSLSDLPVWQYYAYLLLYIAVFLADDAIIFVTAMVTLHASGLTATYSRYSHLIGGIAMVVIGAMLIFKPEWLSFS